MQQNFISLQFRKIIISIVLLFGGTNIAFAEESGAFFGVGIGGGGTTLVKDSNGEIHKETLGGINYGLIDGYRQFFTPNLGLRYYINLDLHHNLTKSSGTRHNIMIIDYGANLDFLWSPISSESLDFGIFIGIGIGGNTIIGKPIATNTTLGSALNAGLRANIATNHTIKHGIEVAVRMPVLPPLYGESPSKELPYISKEELNRDYNKQRQRYSQKFSVILRYVLSI